MLLLPSSSKSLLLVRRRERYKNRPCSADVGLVTLILSVLRLNEVGAAGRTLHERVEIASERGQTDVQLADGIRRWCRWELFESVVNAIQRRN